MTDWQWNERASAGCTHGYPYGDCPLACEGCGHLCELHPQAGPCQGFDCDCQGFVDDEAG